MKNCDIFSCSYTDAESIKRNYTLFSWNPDHTNCRCGNATNPTETGHTNMISGRYNCLSNTINSTEDTSSQGKKTTKTVKNAIERPFHVLSVLQVSSIYCFVCQSTTFRQYQPLQQIIWFYNPYVFATQCCRYYIFKTIEFC